MAKLHGQEKKPFFTSLVTSAPFRLARSIKPSFVCLSPATTPRFPFSLSHSLVSSLTRNKGAWRNEEDGATHVVVSVIVVLDVSDFLISGTLTMLPLVICSIKSGCFLIEVLPVE